VETFWVSRQEAHAERWQRVLPDGCADIIYTRAESRASLLFVGVMTGFKDYLQPAGAYSVAIRIRPAMWADVAQADADTLVDQVVDLEDLWGACAASLLHALDSTDDTEESIRLLAASVPPLKEGSALQRAIAGIESSHGTLSLDEAAARAGLSTRQFRRRCFAAAGLSPEMLSRIARFRHAMQLATSTNRKHAELAFECGYADQSHFIAEFRKFAGTTPQENPRRNHPAGFALDRI
jgi:AraC-like DNA-binding protein